MGDTEGSRARFTGYGAKFRLHFDGSQEKYELWEVKFMSHLRLQKLLSVVERPDSAGVPNDDAEKNAEVFAELVQFLDDKSLSLVIRDAKNDGRRALEILREYYIGSSKPRVLALYTELTSLKMTSTETVTDYVIRAETAATSLKAAGEVVSESLLIAMILKGLPDDYKAFTTVITQKREELKFSDFKLSLRSYEESEKSRAAHSGNDNDSVMKTKYNKNSNIKCHLCGRMGHKKFECKFVPAPGRQGGQGYKGAKSRWCNICKNTTHDTNYCRNNNHVKNVSNVNRDKSDEDSFVFKVDISLEENCNINFDHCDMLVDCGATTHIVCDKSKFTKFDENFDSSKHCIELANGFRSNNVVKAKGDATFLLTDSTGCKRSVILKNALYIPSYNQNIFSVQCATQSGSSVKFFPDRAELKSSNGTLFDIAKQGKLYFLNGVKSIQSCSLEEWHRIMGHCNARDVLKQETVVTGMKITDKNSFNCTTCAEGKMSQYRNHQADEKASKPLELIHCDLSAPVEPMSINNSKYAMTLVDDYSGLIMVYFLNKKSDTVAAMRKFLADISPYGAVKKLRSDNGTEFTSSDFKALLVENKIKHEFSAPYSPHQNGTAERSWRSLFEMARCLLIDADLPKKLWNYAVRAAAYIRNRCYCSRIKMTAFEMFLGKKPDVSNMHIFGCVCYAYIQNKKKLDARSKQGYFVGYDPYSPAYLVYLPQENKVERVRCVKFFNDVMKQNNNMDETEEGTSVWYKYCQDEKKNEENPTVDIPENSERRYPMRSNRRPPEYLKDYETSLVSSDLANCTVNYCYKISDIPKSYSEAMSSNEADDWHKAMNDEMTALKDNETYELTKRPKDKNVIGGRWVFAVKSGPNGEEQFKARYVAKGYSQIQNIDYHETFSPTANITSIRMLMQVAVDNLLHVHQMDVKTAYLNANIDDEIYVEQPDGFTAKDDDGEKFVYKLKKSLYGLKQSSRNWNITLHNYLLSLQFVQSSCDYCVYTKFDSISTVIVIIWVDDLIIAGSNLSVINSVKSHLSCKFKMKDLGQLKWFLGINFYFADNSIQMNQSKYINKLLDKFKMSDCNTKLIPCDLSVKDVIEAESVLLEDAKPYRQIVGSLIYLMVSTRPDLCYIVNMLSQQLAKPTSAHLQLSKLVLKYLRGTITHFLEFSKSSNGLGLLGFTDSDWGGSKDRSISGFCYKLSENSALVSWKSKKQNTVALSSCEAEYIATSFAVQEAIFLQQLLRDMTGLDKVPVHLKIDNQGAIELSKNPVHRQRSKHIDIKYHHVREHVQNGNVVLHYVPSADNIADMFTKPVSKEKLSKFAVVKAN